VDDPASGLVQLVTSPWRGVFLELVDSAEDELLLASPFIGAQPLRQVAKTIERKGSAGQLRVDVVTNLAVDSLLSGSLDVAALFHLATSLPRCTITYVPGLHAKVYVADDVTALITSGNLTDAGLTGNHEYGVLLRDRTLVSRVRTDLIQLSSLGNQVSQDTLAVLTHAAEDLKVLRHRAETSARADLQAAFDERVERATVELLRARARGKTTHGIFADTLLYLLEQRGPLATTELHPLVQRIHPDLCDDTIDRVIDGVHFGKRWKHYVRNAQQALKRRGAIDFDGRRWRRTGPH